MNLNSEVSGIFEHLAQNLDIEIMGFELVDGSSMLNETMDLSTFNENLASIDEGDRSLRPSLKKSISSQDEDDEPFKTRDVANTIGTN